MTDDVQYKIRVVTEAGESPFSIRNTFILASTPSVTQAPVKVGSTETSITVSWQLDSDGGSVITGYRLYQANVTTGGEYLVYDGSNIPTVSSQQIKGLQPGHKYTYRAAALNRVGEGEKSPYSDTFVSATFPGRPEPPTFEFATSTQITLTFTALEDNGGAEVSSYILYADDGDASQENFSPVASYTGSSLSFILDSTVETSFVTGETYRFRISAVNVIGEGPQSNYIRVALARPASPPTAPTINRDLSGTTSMFVQWEEGAAGDIPIVGYRLYMIAKGSGVETLVYDGSLNPLTTQYSVSGLTPGDYYAFYVVALDFNSESEKSEETLAVMCEAPGHMESPYYISSTGASITLGWKQPENTGGCPVLSYTLHMLDSGSGAWVPVDPGAIENKPYLNEYSVTGLTELGVAHQFYISVFNEIGQSDSATTSVKLAAVPDAPADPPAQDYAHTTSSQIKITYEALPEVNNGGSEIMGYDLWRDDGQNGDF